MMNFYARDAFNKKNIVVNPGVEIKAGVTCKPGKAAHGWLRVGTGSDAEFYSLPTEDGQLHASVSAILDSIKKRTAAGQAAKFFWSRSGKNVAWIDVNADEDRSREESDILHEYADKG